MKRSLFRRGLTKLVACASAYDLIPPYDYVQNVIEYNLYGYLGRLREEIASIYIVGGYYGFEVPTLLTSYPNCSIDVFEPSKRYKTALAEKFARNDRVSVHQVALSDRSGEATFYETSARGSGSVLPLGELGKRSYDIASAESFVVPTNTLDSVATGKVIDCLWIDVQGAELLVLQGGKETLHRTRSIFVEVSRLPDLYKGGATMREIETFLSDYGFEITLLGLDRGNLTGNAFYTKRARN